MLIFRSAGRVLGSFQAAPHRIAISEELVRGDQEALLQEVLRHEMAHLCAWVYDGEGGHGPAFRRWCRTFGIPGRATCPVAEDGFASTSQAAERLATRVRKLLALGASPHLKEAQEAVRKANELIRRYNLVLLDESGGEGGEGGRVGDSGEGDLQGVQVWHGKRTPVEVKLISRILGEHFCVYPLFERESGGAALMLYGGAGSLEVAEYVFSYLLRLAGQLWQADRRGRRLSFMVGLFRGFEETLVRGKGKRAPLSDGHALVALRADIARRTAKLAWDEPRRLVSGGGTRYYQDSTFRRGQAAGRRLSLRPGVGGHRDDGGRADPRRFLPKHAATGSDSSKTD